MRNLRVLMSGAVPVDAAVIEEGARAVVVVMGADARAFEGAPEELPMRVERAGDRLEMTSAKGLLMRVDAEAELGLRLSGRPEVAFADASGIRMSGIRLALTWP